MKVIQDTVVQITLPYIAADRVLNHIAKSEQLAEWGTRKELAIYWGQEEAEIFARCTDAVQPSADIPQFPSPMLRDYKWPGIFKPFKHQVDTASFLSIRQRAFCFNEAGTGKTSAAIWAADYLMSIGVIKRALIICPLSIMWSAWQNDIFKTAMHRKAAVAYGYKSHRTKVINSDYEFVIINYDGVNVVANEIATGGFDLIIIDEANAYKNATTKRWKTLAKLITEKTWLWMMTGTPASQSPVDAFGLARLVAPNRVPSFTTAWRDKVMVQMSRFKWASRPNAQELVHRALQPAIRFTKKECLDLPDVMYQTRQVELSPQAIMYYKKLKSQLLIEAAGEQISAVNAASAMSKLLQISSGAVYTDAHEVVEFDISPRLNTLGEVLDETLQKVIVFVPFLHTIGVVTKFLSEEGYSSEVISGSVTARDRANIINKFQTQEHPRVLVIQPQSASHGVTLTAADTVVFWSPVLSVETYLQCIARIDRVGQVNKMTVVHLQGSEVERKVYSALQGKVDSHMQLVDLYKQELEEV
jgi:SNF2 family DNA or RNA helicase